ncbi:MAG: ATP-binding protein [Candidatus Gastranaerophilales bacterium]|nr:ATP-binding protein [Candidatus Gastranaerophilales bacterium]
MIKRTLQKTVEEVSKSFPVLLITGPRQVGKTTLLEMIADKKRKYVTLDDLEQRKLAKTDPAMFLQVNQPPLIIDEIQYAPELFSYIKMYVDTHKKSGDFWLTGSQKFHLMKNITETLAGRVAILDLLGFSYQEKIKNADNVPFLPTNEWIEAKRATKAKALNVNEVYELIYQGSFPKLVTDKNVSRDIFYKSYIQTYIERDVKDITKIGNEIAFYNFLVAMAARTGQLINYSDIARDVDVDIKTAKVWASIIETSGLIKFLQPYYNNITKRIIKTPKMYFLDTGLCAYLTGWDSPKTLEVGAMNGAFFETYVFAEILKSYWNNGKNPNIYFYRDKDQREIDFVFETNGRLYPVEVKKTATPSLANIKSFSVLENLKKPIGEGAVICLYNELLPLNRYVNLIPIGCI